MEKVEQVLLKAVTYYFGGLSLAIGLLGLYGLCRPEFFSKNAEKIILAGKAIAFNSLCVIAVLVIAYIVVYVKDRRNRINNQNRDIS